jgi:predicted O-methyltransferase YrrM
MGNRERRISLATSEVGGPKLAVAALVVLLLCVVNVVGYWVQGPAIFTITVPVGFGAVIVLQLESTARIRERVLATQARVTRVRSEADSAYQQVEALFSVLAMLDLRAPLPPMRGFAISPDFARTLVSVIASRKPRLLLEAGSGVSTLIAAYAIERFGFDCRIVSLDHDERYAESTRASLEKHGLAHAATVVHASLLPVAIAGEEWSWYDLRALQGIDKIDLVVVDGPPAGDGSPMARYPALPLLAPLLNDHAIVLVDDGARAGEEAVVHRWKQEFPGLHVDAIENEKGTFLIEVGSVDLAS